MYGLQVFHAEACQLCTISQHIAARRTQSQSSTWPCNQTSSCTIQVLNPWSAGQRMMGCRLFERAGWKGENRMAVYKQKNSNKWWYKFSWNGQLIRKSTKQTNKRVAEQMEAAHKTSLAKGEVGIREKKRIPTLKEFATQDFTPFVETQFQDKPKTLEYYRNGTKNLLADPTLASLQLDAISADTVGRYVAKRREDGLLVSSINRELEVLRRMLRLALDWGKIEKVPLRISMLPGEKRRELVLSVEESTKYLKAATELGQKIEEEYQEALSGIRATQRNQQPYKPDAFLLRDVVTLSPSGRTEPVSCSSFN